MKNVLVIHGSPHKGHTYRIVQQVEERLKALGEVNIAYVHLADEQLEPCRGCFACVRLGEDLCPIKDGHAALLARMMAADGVIFACPAYCQMVPAVMKNFIDRLSYLFHRPCFFGKQALLVATSAGAGLKKTLDYLEILRSTGFDSTVRLSVMTSVIPAKPLLEREVAAAIDKAVNQFWANLNHQGPWPVRLNDLSHFAAIRGNATWAQRYFPADYAYYERNGWLNAPYYLDVPISPFKRLPSGALIKMIGGMFEKRLDPTR